MSDTLVRPDDDEAKTDEAPAETTTLARKAIEPEPEPIEIDLDARVLSDDPRRERRLGWIIAFLFFGVIVGFSMFARLDAAVYAHGAIAVSGNRQTVQHRDGGTVSALHVREGQRVKAGDVLIELAPADVGAQVASMQSQVISLQAQRARLIAESLGAGTIQIPAEFAALTGAAQIEAQRAMSLQRAEMTTRRTMVARQKSVLVQRQAQLNEQIKGLRAQVVAADEQKRSLEKDLEGYRLLAERGIVSQNLVRDVERRQTGLTGQTENYNSGAAQAGQQIVETQMQALGVDAEHAQKVAQELREVELSLADVTPKYAAMQERLAGTSIRSPVTGQVVGLSIFTIGGVITPGQAIMEVVPEAAPLVIQAQISPVDADDVQVGQPTEVRLVALRDRNVPMLHGEVTAVSADRLVDPKSGQAYYTFEATVPAEEFAKVRRIEGAAKRIRVGLPVEVLVPLRKRTAFQYMVEPLTSAFWRSFREH